MIESLIRKHLRTFQPYKSARSEATFGTILLDANELSVGSPVTWDGIALNRYPDPVANELRERIARQFGLQKESIFLGVGSDEIIDLLLRLFCEPESDRVVILEPTYGVYRVAANFNALRVTSVGLDAGFQIDPGQTSHALRDGAKILFCCSPNNPTGNLLRRDDILKICSDWRGIVVVDEAYVEFAEPASGLADAVKQHPNLVILRTFSKARGLAGIRLGYCIANPLIISYLLAVKSPYNLNAVTLALALHAMNNEAFTDEARASILRERLRLRNQLQHISSVRKVYPSDANFLLVEFEDAGNIYAKLLQRGIIVRRRHEERLSNCLRITIGTPQENTLLLSALGDPE
ncbi:MAG TPA: histidinol-phosphate transaminase [Bacteroidota bacterium]|nr:histidinol-phosphate transaminase [Bacteroidota bacterium]